MFERERERERDRETDRQRETEKECVSRGGAETEGQKESQASPTLSVQSPMQG